MIESLVERTNRNQKATSDKLDNIQGGITDLKQRVLTLEAQVREVVNTNERLDVVEGNVDVEENVKAEQKQN